MASFAPMETNEGAGFCRGDPSESLHLCSSAIPHDWRTCGGGGEDAPEIQTTADRSDRRRLRDRVHPGLEVTFTSIEVTKRGKGSDLGALEGRCCVMPTSLQKGTAIFGQTHSLPNV